MRSEEFMELRRGRAMCEVLNCILVLGIDAGVRFFMENMGCGLAPSGEMI